MEIKAGPNWDDDLSRLDRLRRATIPTWTGSRPRSGRELFEIERLVFFYLPRICNHCLNPACVAACPLGRHLQARRGRHRADQPGQMPRLAHVRLAPAPTRRSTSTGRPASRRSASSATRAWRPARRRPASTPAWGASATWACCSTTPTARRRRPGADAELVEAQRELILDPHDPEVVAAARANGIPDEVIDAAQRSPVYRFVKEWKLALPLHPEYRTLPMLFYVPPLLPAMAAGRGHRASRASSPRWRRRGCPSSTWPASSPPATRSW